MEETLIVVIDGYAQHLLGVVLTNDILIEESLYLAGLVEAVAAKVVAGVMLCALTCQGILKEAVGILNTGIADVALHAGKQYVHITFRPVAEGTFSLSHFCHI